jgi:hypothetical protein
MIRPQTLLVLLMRVDKDVGVNVPVRRQRCLDCADLVVVDDDDVVVVADAAVLLWYLDFHSETRAVAAVVADVVARDTPIDYCVEQQAPRHTLDLL